MKNWLNKFLLIGLASMVLWSCEKDETQAVVKTGASPNLSASLTTLELNGSAPAATAESFTFTGADFGYDAGVTYTLQLAKAGTNFTATKDLDLGHSDSISLALDNATFNQIALVTLGLTAGDVGQVEARVRAVISPKVAPVYSNVVTISVKPFVVVINYPSLWVPGAYQGWAPTVAAKISSVTDNGTYEGFVNISGGDLNFKFTSNPDWDHTNYGWESSVVTGNSVTGTLSTAGSAGNLFVPSAGYYRLKANTNALTWDVVKTDWGLIGDGIPVTGWDSDHDLTYDDATKTWSITLDLLGGKAIKFRANDAWDLNFGDDGANTTLEYNGANISVPTDGNYTVTLNLSTPGAYSYKLVKN